MLKEILLIVVVMGRGQTLFKAYFEGVIRSFYAQMKQGCNRETGGVLEASVVVGWQ